MVVAWPDRIKDAGGHRTQFTHCIDIGPTILEAAGHPPAEDVDGIEQEPMHGTSFVYTFDDAKAAERHTVQYWETYRQPGDLQGRLVGVRQARPHPVGRHAGDDRPVRARQVRPRKDTWELYYLPDDFSQAKDLAEEQPEKLKELKDLSGRRPRRTTSAAAGRHCRSSSGSCRRCRRSPGRPSTATSEHRLGHDPASTGTRTRSRPSSSSPRWRRGRDRRRGRRDGTASRCGSTATAAAPQLLDDGVEQYKQVSTEALPTGDVTVRMQFDADAPKPGTGGDGFALRQRTADRRGSHRQTVSLRFSFYAGHGHRPRQRHDGRSRLRDKAPYAFTGTVKKVVFDLKPAAHEDEKTLHRGGSHGAAVSAINAA